jgi:subtilisin family serine protease
VAYPIKLVNQTGLPYNLPRISHKRIGSTNYTYDDSAGTGTCVFVFDTGYFKHPDFNGRYYDGGLFIKGTLEGNSTDLDGHGTHVAGTVGSSTYGVAKNATIVSVKVCGSIFDSARNITRVTCDFSAVMAGVDWVVNTGRKQFNCTAGTVINMSLGANSPYPPLNTCINDAVLNANIFISVAAGNGDDNQYAIDAANVSPASAALACTVGAIDRRDRIAKFSNFGSPVKILAPGVDILSTWIDNSEFPNSTVR